MSERLGSLAIESETDVLTARRRTRDLAESLGFDTTDQVRIATAISELGRVIGAAGATARIDFLVEQRDHPALVITAHPDRPVTPSSPAPTVTGLVAIRRLMDRVVIGDDNTITMTKTRAASPRARTTRTIAQLRADLARPAPSSPIEEFRSQHDELLRSLQELQAIQDEVVRLNDELQETNRGVVALYAELDERGEQLRAANDAKSRFLANVSHELRSPLNSINGLANLLRDPETDPLTPAQDNQVRLIADALDRAAGRGQRSARPRPRRSRASSSPTRARRRGRARRRHARDSATRRRRPASSSSSTSRTASNRSSLTAYCSGNWCATWSATR